MNLQDNVISSHFSFYRNSDNSIIESVNSIELDDNNCFSSINTTDDGLQEKLDRNSYSYTNLCLSVPGLGYAYCGDELVLEEYRKPSKIWKLNFGWHTNISNQKIYSWFLSDPYEDIDINSNKYKTLYYDDIVNIVGIQQSLPGIIPTDIEENK